MMADLVGTAGQTVGPFFHYALAFPGDSQLVNVSHPGAVRLHGVVHDGAGQPVPDALIEIWQADPDGTVIQRPGSLQRDRATFTGWGRAATNAEGHYSFTTLAPGPSSAGRARFFALTICARGLLDTLFTRAYLPGGNPADDPLLGSLTERRRQTLVCAAEPGGYRFDIHLQGDLETVFLRYAGTDR
jgi:protocatechuate 3,4-dioxygenase, alpha subunit